MYNHRVLFFYSRAFHVPEAKEARLERDVIADSRKCLTLCREHS